MRRRRRQLVTLALIAPVVAGLALVALRGSASSASTVAPSARPTATAFARAYVSFLNGHLAASELPDMTERTRALAASGGRVPAAYRGRVVLRAVPFNGVLGATSASARIIARAGRHSVEAAFALGYAGGHWSVTTLVPPDFPTVFSPPAPPVSVPAAARAAARTFALAYADYRTGARANPPAGQPTLERQIAAGQDPLAATARTGARARLVRMALLPQGRLTAVDAALSAGGRRLSFGFILQAAGGGWQPSSFPVSEP
jgi:hypothetical protein